MYEPDVEIPRRYGIDQTVGDTLGPGGVFRGLRTVPVLVAIAQDMEALCPHALFINYSNPMNINMWGVSAATRQADSRPSSRTRQWATAKPFAPPRTPTDATAPTFPR